MTMRMLKEIIKGTTIQVVPFDLWVNFNNNIFKGVFT